MDENLTRGYCQLSSGDAPQTRRRIEIVSSPPAAGRGRYRARSQVLPPLDNCRLIYVALVLCGAGFLLPYNSFITAVDFYQVPALCRYTPTDRPTARRRRHAIDLPFNVCAWDGNSMGMRFPWESHGNENANMPKM